MTVTNSANSTPPQHDQRFVVRFDNGHTAAAMRVQRDPEVKTIIERLGLRDHSPSPTIFISGGAGGMSEQDTQRTQVIINAVADFAQQHNAIVIDGGTESGVMNMIGSARMNQGHTFPLIGICPMGKISYPGYRNPNEEATLEDSHSHFVLVDGDEWGSESETILRLTHALSGSGRKPCAGILINGGRIASQEVFLASSKEYKLPMIILEGSGRFADEVATAFRTGKANQKILRAILAGGDIQLVGTLEGPKAMQEKLTERFSAFTPRS